MRAELSPARSSRFESSHCILDEQQSTRREALPAKVLERLPLTHNPNGTNTPYVPGIQAVRDPSIFRGVATEKAVRSALGMEGLMPPARGDMQTEVNRAFLAVERQCTDLDKYQALMTLKETSQDVFYALLAQNLTAFLPLIYTPTVGDACLQWSILLRRPVGMYVSIHDMGNLHQLMRNWPEADAKIAVITDGERILGLGDLGAQGMGIVVGKAAVYTAAGGVHPKYILPITVDTGCNTASIRDDPLYVGLPQERMRGQQYDELIDELIRELRKRYGPAMLVHWEDFAARNSFRLLAKYQEQGVPTFNDDIQSTAAAMLAAILGALQLPNVPALRDQRILFFGAGQANIGGARLIMQALMEEGLSQAEARQRIWFYDSKGLVYQGRQERMTPQKEEFARPAEEAAKLPSGGSLADLVAAVRPSALIGAAAKQGAFTFDLVRAMLQGMEKSYGSSARPVVLALSNPSNVAECTAQQAYDWSNGKVAYASGTAFAPFRRRDGGLYVPGQANNSLIFPGIGLGCIASGATEVTSAMMLAAARAVAAQLTPGELSQGSILPQVDRISQVALGVAAAVASSAKAEELECFIRLASLCSSKGLEDRSSRWALQRHMKPAARKGAPFTAFGELPASPVPRQWSISHPSQLLSILTPVFPSDIELGLLKNQLRTFYHFWDMPSLADYVIVVPATHIGEAVMGVLDDVEEMMPHFPRDKLRIIADPQCSKELRPGSRVGRGVVGWMKQQLLKLSCAAIMRTPFYLVTDVDSFFTRNVTALDLFQQAACTQDTPVCDAANLVSYRARNDMFPIQGRTSDQLTWMENSGNTLRMEVPPPELLAIGVTPQVLASDIVTEVGMYLEGRFSVQRWQQYLMQLQRDARMNKPWFPVWTEYDLYWIYAMHTSLWQRYHVECVPWAQEPCAILKHAVWSPSEWEAWKPCETAFDDSKPGLMALVQSNLKVKPADLWRRIAPCLKRKSSSGKRQ
ncbi:hypothetical protein WJX72_004630 [[Myrmecia] bisecta]|uniref:Malic enzyme n=1 Tax=[Myrmecia] bisecta TaxID=41462 RepID=A0AAW1QRD0_9CHLO